MNKTLGYETPGCKQLTFCCEMGEQKINGFTTDSSVSSLLSTILTLTSKKLTDDLDLSCVNFDLGWKSLRRFRNP